ncbi:hypothetical protein [Nonomuraea cavernae]|uniref:Uncharacterized protein n=1 Tax=Nonomuraea cavernae TaxID=2045107 RepID=A0A918DP47_9ACTN|nr:hypothetical protein [Nonomuraea cavernae]MCA2189949.1 hypothetical protein [Nonomuraea cavernae]GGO77978.1 hypothetical protein GCM10012289_58910 [Nonomuraea cavernae]
MPHDHRAALINGLLELAAFLKDHPDLPVSKSLTLHHFSRHDSDAEQCAEIDQIAARIGSVIDQKEIPYGHYATSRRFGPVEYRAVAILAAARARHRAEESYRGCIQPDPAPAT